VPRDSGQVAKLVDSHAEGDTHFDVEFRAADQVVQLELISEAAEDEGGGKSGIAGIEVLRFGEEEIGGEGAVVDTAEDVEGGGASWGQGLKVLSSRFYVRFRNAQRGGARVCEFECCKQTS